MGVQIRTDVSLLYIINEGVSVLATSKTKSSPSENAARNVARSNGGGNRSTPAKPAATRRSSPLVPTRRTPSPPRRSSRKRSGSRDLQISPTQQVEIIAVVLFALAMLLAWALTGAEGAVGAVGQGIRSFLGAGAWLMPLLIGALAIVLIVQGGFNRRVSLETWLGLLLLVLAGEGLLGLFGGLEGGGVVGDAVSRLLVPLLTGVGTFFVFVALGLIGLILAFAVSLADTMRGFARAGAILLGPAPKKEHDDGSFTIPARDSRPSVEPHISRANGGRVSASDFSNNRQAKVNAPTTPLPPHTLPMPSAREIRATADTTTVQRPNRLPPPLTTPAVPLTGEQLPLPIAASPNHNLWQLPPITLLDKVESGPVSETTNLKRMQAIVETLARFNLPVEPGPINTGPAVTQFLISPGDRTVGSLRDPRLERVRVAKIVSLSNDLALALAASSVRIEAPVPGQPYLGIEVPNENSTLVSLRDLIESQPFAKALPKSKLLLGLGKDTMGRSVVTDLAKLPHLLIGGSTGSGKSVALNSIIAGFLFQHTPDSLRMLMIDPKRVELTNFNGIPHLLRPVVVELKHDKDDDEYGSRGPNNPRPLTAVEVLKWALWEMERRYRLFAKGHKDGETSIISFRNIEQYHTEARKLGSAMENLPYIVIIIDELADLMLTAPEEVETAICRLAQLARATGIHLIIATQSPRVDVVTGLIKANFPARIAFAVASMIDSRVILDQPGAEKLLGRGDMLYQAPDADKPVRLQGTYVSDAETERVVSYWRKLAGDMQEQAGTKGISLNPVVVPKWLNDIESGVNPAALDEQEADEGMFKQAVALARKHNFVSVALLQRKLKLGYNKASALIDRLEQEGIVGASEGGRPRPVLLTEDDGGIAEVVTPGRLRADSAADDEGSD